MHTPTTGPRATQHQSRRSADCRAYYQPTSSTTAQAKQFYAPYVHLAQVTARSSATRPDEAILIHSSAELLDEVFLVNIFGQGYNLNKCFTVSETNNRIQLNNKIVAWQDQIQNQVHFNTSSSVVPSCDSENAIERPNFIAEVY